MHEIYPILSDIKIEPSITGQAAYKSAICY